MRPLQALARALKAAGSTAVVLDQSVPHRPLAEALWPGSCICGLPEGARVHSRAARTGPALDLSQWVMW